MEIVLDTLLVLSDFKTNHHWNLRFYLVVNYDLDQFRCGFNGRSGVRISTVSEISPTTYVSLTISAN